MTEEVANNVSEPSLMVNLILKLAEEYKSPISFVVLIALLVGFAWLANDHVSQVQIEKLQAQIVNLQASMSNLQHTLEYDHADSRLRQTQEEIFQLSQHMKVNARLKIIDDDGSDERRMDELKNLEKRYAEQVSILEHEGHGAR